MIGLLGLIILFGKKLSENIRENISITVMLKDNISDEMVMNFRQRLQQTGYVKASEYITRKQAAKDLSNELGEDFVNFLGYNPLPASLDIQLKAGYANSDSIARIEKKLVANNLVKEVVYQKPLIDEVNANIRKITAVIVSFSLILLVISVLLINNTIKLSIYSRRFLIRSMQLVGATENFIRRPFIIRSIVHGCIAALLAVALLVLTLFVVQLRMPEIKSLENTTQLVVFFAGIVVLGIIISGVSTWFSMNKFLRMQVDHLYTH